MGTRRPARGVSRSASLPCLHICSALAVDQEMNRGFLRWTIFTPWGHYATLRPVDGSVGHPSWMTAVVRSRSSGSSTWLEMRARSRNDDGGRDVGAGLEIQQPGPCGGRLVIPLLPGAARSPASARLRRAVRLLPHLPLRRPRHQIPAQAKKVGRLFAPP